MSLTAQPPDAEIRFGVLPVAVGSLSAADLEPGTYELVVTRRGHALHAVAVELTAGQLLEQQVILDPLAQELSVTSEPPGAALRVRSGAAEHAGTTPWAMELPAGPVAVEVALDGLQPESRAFYLEAPTDLELWLDRPGQVLDLQRIVPTGHLPKQVRVTSDNREVWVTALGGPPSVVVHDLGTGAELASLRLGKAGTVEIEFDAAEERAYASQMESGLVYEIDMESKALLRVLDTESLWSKVVTMSADGTAIYVSNWLGNDISEIDLGTGALRRRIPTVHVPRGMYATSDGTALYVAGFDDGHLARIDLATGKSKVVFWRGSNLRHIVGDEERGVLYISDMGRRCIWVYDLETGKVTQLARTDQNANTIDLSADGEVLFVSCRGKNGNGGYLTVGDETGSVLAIDTRSGALLDAIVAGDQPTALDVSTDGSLLVFSDFRQDRLQVFRIPDTETLRAGDGGRADVYQAEMVHR